MAPMAEESMPREVKSMNTSMPSGQKINKGAWTAEEDRKLSEVIAVHGAKRWKIIAAEAGLNRCGKSCRLRWLNYLRPNIKRGNISDEEEDLILRLHKLLGNRWSLIAGRLPGRTDNEIKNYWNSHLSKKLSQKKKQVGASAKKGPKAEKKAVEKVHVEMGEENIAISNHNINNGGEDSNISFNLDDFFDFSNEEPSNLEWMSRFLETGDSLTGMS